MGAFADFTILLSFRFLNRFILARLSGILARLNGSFSAILNLLEHFLLSIGALRLSLRLGLLCHTSVQLSLDSKLS